MVIYLVRPMHIGVVVLCRPGCGWAFFLLWCQATGILMTLSAKQFGLPARTVLEQIDDNTIAIVIDRKSRIIMADGKKIAEKSQKIQEVLPSTAVVLKTTAPVCSKTFTFLQDIGVQLLD